MAGDEPGIERFRVDRNQRRKHSSSTAALVGGAGADTFSFGPTIGLDVIADSLLLARLADIIDFHGSSTLNTR